jgi:hypothetical protein
MASHDFRGVAAILGSVRQTGSLLTGFTPKPAIAIALVASLCGCSLFRQDGLDTAKRVFTIPVLNTAHQEPPYTQVMGNPMPDRAWLRQRASECESWQIGDNGCGTPTRAAASPPIHKSRAVRRIASHVKAAPACNCEPATGGTTAHTPEPPLSNPPILPDPKAAAQASG